MVNFIKLRVLIQNLYAQVPTINEFCEPIIVRYFEEKEKTT